MRSPPPPTRKRQRSTSPRRKRPSRPGSAEQSRHRTAGRRSPSPASTSSSEEYPRSRSADRAPTRRSPTDKPTPRYLCNLPEGAELWRSSCDIRSVPYVAPRRSPPVRRRIERALPTPPPIPVPDPQVHNLECPFCDEIADQVAVIRQHVRVSILQEQTSV